MEHVVALLSGELRHLARPSEPGREPARVRWRRERRSSELQVEVRLDQVLVVPDGELGERRGALEQKVRVREEERVDQRLLALAVPRE